MADYEILRKWTEEAIASGREFKVYLKNGCSMRGIPVEMDNQTLVLKDGRFEREEIIFYEFISTVKRPTGSRLKFWKEEDYTPWEESE